MPKEHPERVAIRAFVSSHAADLDISRNGRLFAGISSWVYDRDKEPADVAWRSPGQGIEDFADGATPAPEAHANGYDGGAFYHRASATLILANRGTEEWGDWANNLDQTVTGKGPQMDVAAAYAVRAVRHARGQGLTLNAVVAAGHSLGGGLAQAQFACLNPLLALYGEEPVANVYGHATAAAPFGRSAQAMRLACNGGLLHPPESDRFQSRLCPTDPITLAGDDRIGIVQKDLPEVWSVFRNPHFGQAKALGERRFHLERYRNPAHSAFRYFAHWDTGPGRCIVVSHDGQEHVLQCAELPNAIQRRFNNFKTVWAEILKH